MPKREYDPLALIPSAHTIRRKLTDVLEKARRLRVLLRTAEQIERDRNAPNPTRREVAHDGN